MQILRMLCILIGVLCIQKKVLGKLRGTPGIDYPNYSAIPKTSFKCSEPGFYADFETKCQVFHYCYQHRQESFLCPTGTIFNQAIKSCDYWYSADCKKVETSYDDYNANREKNKFSDLNYDSAENPSNIYSKIAALYIPRENSENLPIDPFLDGSSETNELIKSMEDNSKHFQLTNSSYHDGIQNDKNVQTTFLTDEEYLDSIRHYEPENLNIIKYQQETNDYDKSINVLNEEFEQWRNHEHSREENLYDSVDFTMHGISDNPWTGTNHDSYSSILDKGDGSSAINRNVIEYNLGEQKEENDAIAPEEIEYSDNEIEQFPTTYPSTLNEESLFSENEMNSEKSHIKHLPDKKTISKRRLRRKPKYVVLQTDELEGTSSPKISNYDNYMQANREELKDTSKSFVITYTEKSVIDVSDPNIAHKSDAGVIGLRPGQSRKQRKPVLLLSSTENSVIDEILASESPSNKQDIDSLMPANVLDVYVKSEYELRKPVEVKNQNVEFDTDTTTDWYAEYTNPTDATNFNDSFAAVATNSDDEFSESKEFAVEYTTEGIELSNPFGNLSHIESMDKEISKDFEIGKSLDLNSVSGQLEHNTLRENNFRNDISGSKEQFSFEMLPDEIKKAILQYTDEAPNMSVHKLNEEESINAEREFKEYVNENFETAAQSKYKLRNLHFTTIPEQESMEANLFTNNYSSSESNNDSFEKENFEFEVSEDHTSNRWSVITTAPLESSPEFEIVHTPKEAIQAHSTINYDSELDEKQKSLEMANKLESATDTGYRSYEFEDIDFPQELKTLLRIPDNDHLESQYPKVNDYIMGVGKYEAHDSHSNFGNDLSSPTENSLTGFTDIKLIDSEPFSEDSDFEPILEEDKLMPQEAIVTISTIDVPPNLRLPLTSKNSIKESPELSTSIVHDLRVKETEENLSTNDLQSEVSPDGKIVNDVVYSSAVPLSKVTDFKDSSEKFVDDEFVEYSDIPNSHEFDEFVSSPFIEQEENVAETFIDEHSTETDFSEQELTRDSAALPFKDHQIMEFDTQDTVMESSHTGEEEIRPDIELERDSMPLNSLKPGNTVFTLNSIPLPTNAYERDLYIHSMNELPQMQNNDISSKNPPKSIFYRELDSLQGFDKGGNSFPAPHEPILLNRKDSKVNKPNHNNAIDLDNRFDKAKPNSGDSSFPKSNFPKDHGSTRFPTFPTSTPIQLAETKLYEGIPENIFNLKTSDFMFSSRTGKFLTPPKITKIVSFGKKLLAMKRAKLNILKRYLNLYKREN